MEESTPSNSTSDVSGENNSDKPSYNVILSLISRILTNVLNDYQGWFFITSSLINSYGNSIENFKIFFIILDDVLVNMNGNTECIRHNNPAANKTNTISKASKKCLK